MVWVDINNSLAIYTTTLSWTGSVSRYPFDKYTALLSVMAFAFIQPTNCPVRYYAADTPYLGVSASLYPDDNTLTDFDLSIAGTLLDNEDNHQALIILQRKFASLIFPIIFLIISWMLTICFVVVTIIIANLPPDTSERDFMLPTVATLGVTFLFALPTVRGTLPGIPPGATLLDVVAYFWNIVLVVLSVVVLLCLYIVNLWRKFQPSKYVPIPSTDDSEAKQRDVSDEDAIVHEGTAK